MSAVRSMLTQTIRKDMQTRELPFPTPIITLSQAWHPRFNNDYEHKMLRQIIYDICKTISAI